MERDAEVIEVLNELVSRKLRGSFGSGTTGFDSMAAASTTGGCIECTASSG